MKTWLRSTNGLVFSLAVIGLFILLNVVLASYDRWQWDVTSNQTFTLSQQTTDVLKSLQQPVKAKAFLIGDDPYVKKVRDLLDAYKRYSSQFSYEVINPQKDPLAAQQYEIEMPTIIFELGKKSQRVTFYEVFPDNSPNVFSGEQRFTQALIQLLGKNQKILYVLTAHDELPLDEAKDFKLGLEAEGYAVKTLNLVRDPEIPKDATALLILGPVLDLSKQELQLIQAYLAGDGKLLLTLANSPNVTDQKNVNQLLQQFGLTNQRTVVVQLANNEANNPFITVPFYAEHEMNEDLLKSDKPTVMAYSVSLSAKDNKTDWVLNPVLKTNEFAFAKKDRSVLTITQDEMDQLQQTEEDLAGPLDLAYAVEDEQGQGKVVVVGNTLYLSDFFFNRFGNRDFALNSIAWLTGNESLVSIRPKEENVQSVAIPYVQLLTINIGILLVLPVVFLVIGIVIWWRRRRG